MKNASAEKVKVSMFSVPNACQKMYEIIKPNSTVRPVSSPILGLNFSIAAAPKKKTNMSAKKPSQKKAPMRRAKTIMKIMIQLMRHSLGTPSLGAVPAPLKVLSRSRHCSK